MQLPAQQRAATRRRHTSAASAAALVMLSRTLQAAQSHDSRSGLLAREGAGV
jgi:hypothetical protein